MHLIRYAPKSRSTFMAKGAGHKISLILRKQAVQTVVALLFLLLAPQVSLATTWISQGSGVTQDLFGIWGSSPADVYVVGASGIIIYSSDGGKTWQPKKSNTQDALFDIWGASAEALYAVGASGVILSSKDKGESWKSSSFDEGFTLRGVWGSSANDLYIVGEGGTILHSTDGSTWVKQQSNTTRTLHSIWGLDAKQVYAVGEEGTILSTNDGGKTWISKTSGTIEILRGIWGSAQNICVVGYHTTILCSKDSGQSWTSKSAGGSEWLTSAWGDEKGEVYAVGQKGLLRTSLDGGETFAAPQNVTTGALFDVWGASSIDVYLVGKSGTILRSEPPRPHLELVAKSGDACAAGAEVFVDGNSWGSLPLAQDPPAGRHFIQAKKVDCKDFEQWLDAAPGQIYSIEIALSLIKRVTLRVSGTVGASLYFDGVLQGKLPLSIERVDLGQHSILVKKEGFKDWSQPLTIEEDGVPVIVALEALPSPSLVPTILLSTSLGSGAVGLMSLGFARDASKTKGDILTLPPGQEPSADLAAQITKLERRAIALSWGGGAALGIAAASGVALYLWKKKDPEQKPKVKTSISLSPTRVSIHTEF